MSYNVKLPASIACVLEASKDDVPTATSLGCTLGASTQDVSILVQLLEAGCKVARIDLAGPHDMAFHVRSWLNLQKACKQANKLCAVMVSPPGPDVRVLNRPAEPIQLQAGQLVRISSDASLPATPLCLPVTFPDHSFHTSGICAGSSVFIGQYLFSGAETSSAYLTVQSVEPRTLLCVANNTCSLEGVQLTVKFSTDVSDPLPTVGAQDEALLKQWVAAVCDAAIQEGMPAEVAHRAAVDSLGLPRTRSARDVAKCRAMLKRLGLGHCQVVCKLEDAQGLANHAEILEVCDALILSRGTLGVCMESEKVFVAQKALLHACNAAGKPVYVTRLVDSMTEAPRPTRAEATDVANLCLDGADGLLLGSETFRGKYPVDALKTVSAICRSAEAVFDNYAFYRSMMAMHENPMHPLMDKSEALASSAVRGANKMEARLIVAFTVTGRTARLLAKYKPMQPILAVVCTDPSAAQFSAPEGAYWHKPSGAEAQGGSERPGSPFKAAKTGDHHSPCTAKRQLSVGLMGIGVHRSQAKACLGMRGVIPVMVEVPPGSQGADLLEAVLEYGKGLGLVCSGDKVVVMQCPRPLPEAMPMNEAGVVSLITVDHALL